MPRHARSRRARTAVKAVLAVMLAVLAVVLVTRWVGGEDESSAATESADPTTSASPTEKPPEPSEPEPREGICHTLTAADVRQAHDLKPATPCGKPHTTQTYYVGRFDLATFEDRSPDTAAVARVITPACTRQFERWVGGDRTTRALTRVHPVWFVPSTRDIQLGARWFRCDVIVAATDTRLAELPRDTAGLLDSGNALQEYGMCSRGSPERSRSVTVICGRSHSWRAFRLVRPDTGKSDAFPTRRQLREAGDRCERRARRELDYPLKWRYGWQPPTQAQWASGVRWGVCWVPSD